VANHHEQRPTEESLVEVLRTEGSLWPEERREISRGDLLNTTTESVTVSPSPQSKDEENEKLHKLREYARDFRRQHTTDAEQFDWDSDDGDYGLAIGRLVIT
jgi:hypothetical protein